MQMAPKGPPVQSPSEFFARNAPRDKFDRDLIRLLLARNAPRDISIEISSDFYLHAMLLGQFG